MALQCEDHKSKSQYLLCAYFVKHIGLQTYMKIHILFLQYKPKYILYVMF